MAYIGNKDGPRESTIVETLGPAYFGVSWRKLLEDIEWFRFGESFGEVVPVRLDKKRNAYLTLSVADGLRRLYLFDYGFELEEPYLKRVD